MGKRILCIGDSNTWGYIPGSGERYEKNVRWTGKLAQTLGENYEVIEEGMNGRTTAFTDKIEPGTAALDYLYPCLISQFPLDYIIVMLGTNDTKTRYGVNTVEIGYGLDEVLLKIEETCRRKSQTPEKIVIAPADLYPKKDWIEFTAESAQKAGLEPVVFLHYPPLFGNSCNYDMLEVLHKYGIKKCFYGHLHGRAHAYAINGTRDGVEYRLIASDFLHFDPLDITKIVQSDNL